MPEGLWWIVTLVVPAVAIIVNWRLSRRQVAEALDDARKQLEAERQVTARVSHRLRNPLTVIYGFSETLLDSDLDDPDEVKSVVNILSAEALDVSRTVEDLVASSEIQRDDLVVRSLAFDPAAEVERAVLPFRRLGAEISVECWTGTAMSDPVRFRQIIQNLVSNAVRFGGSEITVVADIQGSDFQCTVADDGEGLPGYIATRVFGPQTTEVEVADPGDGADESRASGDDAEGDASADRTAETAVELVEPRVDVAGEEGLGLGLTVASGLATTLGGSLTYERLSGLSMFTLVLPTAEWPGPLEPITRTPEADDQVEAESQDDESEDQEQDVDASDGTDDQADASLDEDGPFGPTIRFDTPDPEAAEEAHEDEDAEGSDDDAEATDDDAEASQDDANWSDDEPEDAGGDDSERDRDESAVEAGSTA